MKRRYGFFTAIAMIVGVVIGSGIFFKSDNVLIATGGRLWLGVILFCVAAVAIIFGALAIGELAKRSKHPGGIVAYAEEYYSRRVACGYGWFQTFMYFPALQAVVSWVAGVYVCMLFSVPSTLINQVLIGTAILVALHALNVLAPRIAGYLQISTTIVKIIPLVFLAVAGLAMGGGELSMPVDSGGLPLHKATFLAAIPPVAFAFDGWIAATSISRELKRERRDLPLALVIAPIFILLLYLLYYVGIVKLVGVESVMELGDNHVYAAAQSLLGAAGARVVIAFVLVSVLGTCNGLVLSHIRMPIALAEKNMLFGSKYFRRRIGKGGYPLYSALFSFGLAMMWMLAHYLSERYNLMLGSDVSEISIVAQYIMFVPLYYQVFKLWRKGAVRGWFIGVVVPVLATLGSIFTFIGGFTNKLFFVNLALVAAVLIAAAIYESHRKVILVTDGEDGVMPMIDVSPDDSIDIAISAIENIQAENDTESDNIE